VSSSNLTREATYWAFWQFYTPKVGFSLLTLHLTQAECKRIQSPAICATLSKLHFNRCTSRAIVFGSTKYAGLDLPHLATAENVGQLRLLLGHLHFQDKTADLILIDISYIQLLVGSSTIFFNLPYDTYKWLVDDCWLTSIWAFLSTIQFQLAIKRAYIPSPQRDQDVALMDLFVSQKYDRKRLMALNRCRVFLRVLFLSDICSADGTTILHAFRKGERLTDRISNLDWPFQPRPPRLDWLHWERSLASLEECGKLLQPLGPWVACSHQQWQCFYDSSTTTVYHKLLGSTWRRYHHQICVHQSNHNTRHSSVPWLSTNHFSEVTSKPADAIVASMDIDPLYDDHLFRVSVSPNAMPNHLPTVCLKGGDAHIVFKEGTPEPHSFYHQLLQWDMSLIAPQVTPIADAIRNGDLHVCADGAYMPDLQQGAQAWVFSMADQTILWKSAGPSPGLPINMTPYRIELCGLVSTLFTIHWICRSANISYGHITIYCDNESALHQMFTPTRTTNNPYKLLKADIDLLTCGCDLLLQLPIEVSLKHKWVKGHFKGDRRLLQHNLNEIADCLARDFNTTPRTPCKGNPVICPTSEAELIYRNCVVTSCLLQLVKSSLHDPPLKEHIIQRAKWNHSQFDRVGWVAHAAAFHQHSRLQRLSITKLVHGLYHTNSEAHKL
jgi:hypothetical protein